MSCGPHEKEMCFWFPPPVLVAIGIVVVNLLEVRAFEGRRLYVVYAMKTETRKWDGWKAPGTTTKRNVAEKLNY